MRQADSIYCSSLLCVGATLQSGKQIKTHSQAGLQVSEWACKQLGKEFSRCMTAAKPASSKPQKGIRYKGGRYLRCTDRAHGPECMNRQRWQVAVPAQTEWPRLKAMMGKHNSEAYRKGIGQAEACSGNGAGCVKSCCAPKHWQTQKEDCKGHSPYCTKQSDRSAKLVVTVDIEVVSKLKLRDH